MSWDIITVVSASLSVPDKPSLTRSGSTLGYAGLLRRPLLHVTLLTRALRLLSGVHLKVEPTLAAKASRRIVMTFRNAPTKTLVS